MTTTWLTRAQWRSPKPLTAGHLVTDTQFVGAVAHHTVTVMQDYDGDGFKAGDLDDIATHMRILQTIRPDLGSEVPYSWVIFPGATANDGVVCEGRGARRTGAHTSGYNSTRYGIAFAGNYMTDPITPGMVAAFREVCARHIVNPVPQPTIGHRDVDATLCPGDNVFAALSALQPPWGATPTPPSDQPSSAILGPVGSGFVNTGPEVERWQHLINTLLQMVDLPGSIDVTGRYDAITQQVTLSFQRWHNRRSGVAPIDDDGLVGNDTRGAMTRWLNHHAVLEAQRRRGYRPDGPGVLWRHA